MRHEKALLRADRKAFSIFEKSYYGDIACARSLSSCTEIYCATTYKFVTKAFFAERKFSLEDLNNFRPRIKILPELYRFIFRFIASRKIALRTIVNFQEAVQNFEESRERSVKNFSLVRNWENPKGEH